MSAYVPHSEKTQRAYEKLLRRLREHVPPFTPSLIEIAERFITIVQDRSLSPGERQRDISALLDKTISEVELQPLMEFAMELTDFVRTAPDASRGLPASLQPETHADENMESGSSSSAELASAISLDDEEEQSPQQSFSVEEIMSSKTFVFDSVTRMFPASSVEECGERTQRLLKILRCRDHSNEAVEAQLNACFGGYDSDEIMEWIEKLVKSRWAVVYGTALANAVSRQMKAAIVCELETHAKTDRNARQVCELITNKPVEEEGKAKGDTHHRELRLINLQGLGLEDEAAAHRNVRAMLPTTTSGVGGRFDTHDEVILPPSGEYRGNIAAKNIDDAFPPWAQEVFKTTATATLNPMQSKVYDCAFLTDNNMLVCAPTGAGKTNIAMMAILRAIAAVYDGKAHSFDLSKIKMVYVAPMKALVQEVVATFSQRLQPVGITVRELSGDSGERRLRLLGPVLGG